MTKTEPDFPGHPHGWYAVANNMSGVERGEKKLELDREAEAKYFQDHPLYRKPVLQRQCGRQNLVKKLARYVSFLLFVPAEN